jgi:hypothetical protein
MALEGLRRKWQELQGNIDSKNRERHAPEGARSLHHEKVLQAPNGGPSPLERADPHRAEAARLAAQWRERNPAPAQQPQRMPTQNTPQPVGPRYGNGPSVAAPGVAYVQATVPANNPNLRPAELPLIDPVARNAMQSQKAMPHERLAAKLDRANEQTLQAFVEQRTETTKNYEKERWISGR